MKTIFFLLFSKTLSSIAPYIMTFMIPSYAAVFQSHTSSTVTNLDVKEMPKEHLELHDGPWE